MLLTDEENRISIPIAGAIGALVGWALPGITIGNLAQQRQLAILREIPYSIDLIASAMRGGLDFTAAVRFYVKGSSMSDGARCALHSARANRAFRISSP